MTTGETESKGWFTRPGILIGVLVVGLIIGVVIAFALVKAIQGGNNSGVAVNSSNENARVSKKTSKADESICGLNGAVLEKARLPEAPEADNWEYESGVAYPVSKKYGPGAAAPEGYRYCFRHTPEGALFAASYIITAMVDQSDEWAEYIIAKDTPNRSELLKDDGDDDDDDDNSYRVGVGGFRLQSYDGKHATVDLGIWVKARGRTGYGSVICHLVWEDGDWKFRPENTEDPLESVQLPDLDDYIPWGERYSQ